MRPRWRWHQGVSGTLLATALCLVALLGPAAAMESGSYAIRWSVHGSAGGRASSSSYSLQSTLGQASIGLKASADYGVCSGFWCALGHRLYLPVVARAAP